jgi:hypothetical protein
VLRKGLRRIFAKIRTFAISASIWTRAETHLHVFDASWPRQSTPGARPRAPRATPSQARATAHARAYNASRGFNRTPPLALDLAGAQDHRRLPRTRRANGRPSTHHRRPANRAIPSPVRSSRETLRASVKLLERGIELCLAGDTRSRSPDFTQPPASVDRAPRWAFLQFLARVDSLAPREASHALGLNYIAMDRPEHPPPTSSPACVRGPADSGHHRRRAIPRRYRKDFPEPTPSFAGPPSALVSRAALFSSAGTFKRGRDLGEEGKEVRGVLNGQRLRWIVAQGYKLKSWFRKTQGPRCKLVFQKTF